MKNESNDLLYRFTAWIELVVKRAKIDYIRHHIKAKDEVSFDDDILKNTVVSDRNIDSNTNIEFCNERLAKAFDKLSANRKKILIMLYIERIPPEEIAKEYGYTLRYVYNIKMRAITDLRKLMSEDN